MIEKNDGGSESPDACQGGIPFTSDIHSREQAHQLPSRNIVNGQSCTRPWFVEYGNSTQIDLIDIGPAKGRIQIMLQKPLVDNDPSWRMIEQTFQACVCTSQFLAIRSVKDRFDAARP